MNQPLLLHIVERLEAFLGKLPATIQKPILHELTPLKELFLQQRAPRFVVTGSNKIALGDFTASIFGSASGTSRHMLFELFRWQTLDVNGRGEIKLLDARGADESAIVKVREELKREPADIFFYVDLGSTKRVARESELTQLSAFLARNDAERAGAKIIGITLGDAIGARGRKEKKQSATDAREKLHTALHDEKELCDRVLDVFDLTPAGDEPESRALVSLLAKNVPNEARVEMIRLSGDREAQREIAQVLVKSTTAICTAVGTQPIPLADLPILTTLQLVMVSGIMYISGRERSLRAATEFIGALGANVGAGMLLREGTRAVLKFFPGWGNLVCGMVAGAGTYGMGRAATAYFLEGASLKDARRTYRTSRKKPDRSLHAPKIDIIKAKK
ncbi:MAG: hypothetical protein QOI04_1990 [Verrucomicrobiota bacterium]